MSSTTARTRPASLLAGAMAALLTLSACGSDQPESQATTTVPETAAAFPVTIDTAYGPITVEEKPERIVATNERYIELLPHLGEVAVANAMDPASVQSYQPWLADAAGGEQDTGLITAEYLVSPEAVAVWEPDLILTQIWFADEALYGQLSQIAPTYVGIETDTQTDWQDDLASLAALTGHDPGIVAEVEAELDAEFSAAAEQLAGLQGKTFLVAVLSSDGQLWPTEYANAPIIALGLVPAENQPADGETSADATPISLENIEQIQADVVFVAASGAVSDDAVTSFYTSMQEDPRVADLPATRNETLLYLDTPQWFAINGGSPMSYRWWLAQILPQLEASALNQSGE